MPRCVPRDGKKQFGSEQPFLVENIGEHPIFSDFRVTNPTSGSVYRVAIRGASPGRNFCSCFDFKTNSLGTCKHIELTLKTLLARRGAKRAFAAGHEPPYSSVSVEYGPQRHVSFRAGTDWPDPLRRLASRHFDKAGRLKPAGFDRFDRFVAEAKEIDPELRLYDDVLPFVAEVRDARRRAGIIDKAFPRRHPRPPLRSVDRDPVVPQTFGSSVNAHPHVHAIASRGGWTKDGTWVPIPYVDSGAAARLFRHKVLRLLLYAGRIDAERVEMILGWRLRERLLGSQRGRGPGRRAARVSSGSRITSPGRR